MKVEVEIEDLETIIFATAVIKNIESQLQARKTDPFVRQHLEYTTASNNLTAAMNGARRSADTSNTITQWDGKLNKDEIKFLQKFDQYPVFEATPDYRLKHDEVDTLAAKGCIRIGQRVAGAIWPGETKADLMPVVGFCVAITQQGRDKLKQAIDEVKS